MNDAGAQRQLLATLAAAGVDFVVVGGHAVAAHGFERGTRDVDIVFSTDAANCQRFATALSALGASIAVADLPAPQGPIAGEWLARGGHFAFNTEYGLLDALSWIAGLDYPALVARAQISELADGTKLSICSYEDLVHMKQAGNRLRDRDDLAELEAIRGGDDE